jgi:uncharacterized membrane protein
MIKKNLKAMILTSIVILAPIVVGLILWDKLPAEMATHFNETGKADGWSPKGFAIIGLPLLLLAVHWFCMAFTSVDPKNKNISDKIVTLVLWICPVISILGSGAMYLYALDNSVNTTSFATLIVGCVFLVIGNYMPKMKQSYTIGIKLPWTLDSEENWYRTHRFAGYAFMIAGVVTIIAGFIDMFWLILVALFIASILPAIYSYMLYRKGV